MPLTIGRPLGLLLGVLADARWGDPAEHHPVAWFGSWAAAVERRLYSPTTARGAVYTVVTVAPWAVGAVLVERVTRRNPWAHALATAVVTWGVLGARRLADEGHLMADRLEAGDREGARAQLPHLCGRDPHGLDADDLARATVESLAENTADAAVASLFWGALAGVPGLVVHRAVNTLDAMVGYRNDRYARFGTAAARLDDLLDLMPARLTGTLACALASEVGGSRRDAARVMLRDASDHPSPNGGWCEAAWAGALGVRLGGANTYGDRVEVRGTLGDPDAPRPDAWAVLGASRLVTGVTAAATALAVGAAWLVTKEAK